MHVLVHFRNKQLLKKEMASFLFPAISIHRYTTPTKKYSDSLGEQRNNYRCRNTYFDKSDLQTLSDPDR